MSPSGEGPGLLRFMLGRTSHQTSGARWTDILSLSAVA